MTDDTTPTGFDLTPDTPAGLVPVMRRSTSALSLPFAFNAGYLACKQENEGWGTVHLIGSLVPLDLRAV